MLVAWISVPRAALHFSPRPSLQLSAGDGKKPESTSLKPQVQIPRSPGPNQDRKASLTHTRAPGSLSVSASNAVEQNVKPKKTPSQTEPFESMASLQDREWGEPEDRQSLALERLKRVSRNATSQIRWGLGGVWRAPGVEQRFLVRVGSGV